MIGIEKKAQLWLRKYHGDEWHPFRGMEIVK